jgi:phosphatidate cytidylyltransferase
MEQFKRIISALVILPPLVLFLYYAPPVLFLILVLLLVSLSLREYLQLLAMMQLPVCAKMSYTVAFLLVLTAYAPDGERWLPRVLSLGMVVLAVGVMMTVPSGAYRFPALVHSLFGILFIGWSLSHLILLRNLADGQWSILFLCTIVWVGDSTAMYVGKLLGRHKMAPTISPGKTWEGAVGCILGYLLAAALGARFLVPRLVLWQSLVLGLVISFAAQISDLSESLIKRYAGVKDSGELIPGHGGLLDRIDSVLFATPMFFYTQDLLAHVVSP